MNNAPLIGKRIPGIGGRDCACCNEAPGKARKRDRRVAKRRERQAWRKSLDS